ncbi:MAG TPA: glutathione S-transferase [Usitatibacter sp.]|nr:glutathione S-transferase [Usitatibacter sp.]
MITIHHLSASRSERIVWLAEELGIAYELRWHQREPNGAAPAALREVHALGKSPVIEDEGLVLAESGAIVEYIVNRHGAGRLAVKPEAPEYPGYVYWMHFAEGSLMTLMLIALVLSRVPEAKDGPVQKRISTRLQDMLRFVDARLAGHEYFAGNQFTAADIMMSFPFTTMKRYLPYEAAPLTHVSAWLARIEARPAYAKAMALAGPDAVRRDAA